MIKINQEAADRAARIRFKAERELAVDSIVVTTASGLSFDGDEASQGRIARAILGLQGQSPGAVVQWVLSDNTVVDVGIEDLQEALTLAGIEQARLWVQES